MLVKKVETELQLRDESIAAPEKRPEKPQLKTRVYDKKIEPLRRKLHKREQLLPDLDEHAV